MEPLRVSWVDGPGPAAHSLTASRSRADGAFADIPRPAERTSCLLNFVVIGQTRRRLIGLFFPSSSDRKRKWTRT